MERRFFERADAGANGELIWATRNRLGRTHTHRCFLRTENVSLEGARLILAGDYSFPLEARGRLKIGLQFCDVQVRAIEQSPADQTILRVVFLSPTPAFLTEVEKYLPISNWDDRAIYQPYWTGDD